MEGASAIRPGRGPESKGLPHDVRLQVLSSALDSQKILRSPAVLAVIGLLLFLAFLIFFFPRLFGHMRVVDKKKKVAHIV